MKITLNLLPREKNDQIKFKGRCHVALKLIVMANLAVIVYVLFIIGCLQVISIQKKTSEMEIARIQDNEVYRQVKEDQELIKEYNKMATVIENGLSMKPRILPFFESINEMAGEGIIFDQIKIDAKTAYLKGEGKERQEIIELKEKLEKSGDYSKVESPISNLTQDKNVAFEFNLDFKSTEK